MLAAVAVSTSELIASWMRRREFPQRPNTDLSSDNVCCIVPRSERVESGEWGMGSGEWGVGEMQNAECKM
jgi:hypothetical protein